MRSLRRIAHAWMTWSIGLSEADSLSLGVWHTCGQGSQHVTPSGPYWVFGVAAFRIRVGSDSVHRRPKITKADQLRRDLDGMGIWKA